MCRHGGGGAGRGRWTDGTVRGERARGAARVAVTGGGVGRGRREGAAMGGEAAAAATAAAATGRVREGRRRRRRRRVLSFVGQTAHTRRNEPLSYGPVSACALFTHTHTHTHGHKYTRTPQCRVSRRIIIFKKKKLIVSFFLFPPPPLSCVCVIFVSVFYRFKHSSVRRARACVSSSSSSCSVRFLS